MQILKVYVCAQVDFAGLAPIVACQQATSRSVRCSGRVSIAPLPTAIVFGCATTHFACRRFRRPRARIALPRAVGSPREVVCAVAGRARRGSHRPRVDAGLRSAQRCDPARLPGSDHHVGRTPHEKGLTHDRAVQLATNVWTSVEGALVLSRVLRSPEPFDMAIAQLTATAEADADASIS